MTLKQENGIAALLAALPAVLFLALSDRLSTSIYTHIGGPGGVFISKAGFAKAVWFFGALQYGLCLGLRGRFQDWFPRVSAAYPRFLTGALLSAAVTTLILSNLA